MQWNILHRTHYAYEMAVRDSFNEVRLKPVTNEHQRTENFLLKIQPACKLRHYEDLYHNWVHHFDIPEPHTSLTIESQCQVTTLFQALPLDAMPADLARLEECARSERCFDFLQASEYVDPDPEVWRLAVDITHGCTDIWQASVAIMRYVHAQLTYTPLSTHVHTHMREVLQQRQGVCQDFAHVMLGLCRSIRIPALYVSGYLAVENASATHAWVEVFIPDIGWRALDPTHNRTADESYIKLAVGRDYSDVQPVRGRYRGNTKWSMQVEVQIEPVKS
ncbi:MAG TPA: transglutaminase family protein [Candidatus Limnocylindria bacterium]|jgi:transglutaminase-like putative cysteine protease|nr:transglutaminase family protein [Candidatus Limnocylindria bacterium]